MAKFFYKAKKGLDHKIEDIIEANDLESAVEKITALGYVPLDVSIYVPAVVKNIPTQRTKPLFLSRKISSPELVALTRQLYDLIDSGVPFLKALSIAQRQSVHPRLKKILNEIYEFVKDGGLFSDALSQHKDVFPVLYRNMIKAGEISGHLETVLDRLAMFLENDDELRTKVKNSLIYPGLILGVGSLTIFVLLTFVIPRLTEMFDDLSATLPWPTVFLMSLSGFLARFWWLIAVVLVLLILYIKQVATTDVGKYWLDQQRLRMPVLGSFVQHVEIGRFARTLSMLLDSGVAIVPALESVSDILVNDVLRQEVRRMARQIDAGSSMNEALKDSATFPEIAKNMIVIGEESGKLSPSLLKLAISYEKKSDAQMKAVTSLIEPLLIIVIGLAVGFVVVSMLLPIFQMNFIIQ